MSWGRLRIGNVKARGCVHYLYEWRKEGRLYWDTQCSIIWENRDNTDKTRRPRVTKVPVNCVECLAYQIEVGAPL